jgi:hypothetical protein
MWTGFIWLRTLAYIMLIPLLVLINNGIFNWEQQVMRLQWPWTVTGWGQWAANWTFRLTRAKNQDYDILFPTAWIDGVNAQLEIFISPFPVLPWGSPSCYSTDTTSLFACVTSAFGGEPLWMLSIICFGKHCSCHLQGGKCIVCRNVG